MVLLFPLTIIKVILIPLVKRLLIVFMIVFILFYMNTDVMSLSETFILYNTKLINARGGENLEEKRDWLIQKRKEKNLDQKHISEMVGVTQQFYNYIENGKRRPSPEIAQKLAEILDFDWTLFYKNET